MLFRSPLTDHRHNRCRRYSYVGKHFVFQLDVSLYVGSFHLAGKTARLVRVIGFSTWQSISACRLGSCARRDVPLARTPPTSCRSPRRPRVRKHLIAAGPRRPRRLGFSPIQCAARCRYSFVAHGVADRAAVKPQRRSWRRSWGRNSPSVTRSCAANRAPTISSNRP